LAPLDGLVWFMPLVASLLLCWWGLFAAQRRSGNQTGRWSRQDICEALEFVGIRAAVYLIPTLVPLAMVMAAQALARSPWVRGAPWGASAIYGGVLICFLACMPWVLAVSWRTRRLPPSPLRLALENLTPGDRPFRDVRIWPTGHQMTNALVIGAIPRLRLLVLTDRLVRLMDASELVAVVRHELGHIRRHHLTTRLLFLLLPIAASSSFVLIGSTEFGADSRVGELDLARTSEVWVAIGAVYAIYAFAALGWLSRAMEHDADLFACRADLKRGSRLSPDATQEYCGALTKLCADSGGDSGRSDWLHPSLRSRIDLLQSCLADGSRVASFEREFARRKWTLAAIAIGGGALAAWL
jgi:Zn-dependent protease with chaperone function